jgi:hypothetical protein
LVWRRQDYLFGNSQKVRNKPCDSEKMEMMTWWAYSNVLGRFWFLEPLKEATNAVGNFLPNEIEMKIFDKFVMLSLQLQDM